MIDQTPSTGLVWFKYAPKWLEPAEIAPYLMWRRL